MARQLGDTARLTEEDVAIYDIFRGIQEPVSQLEVLRRVDDALEPSLTIWSSTAFIAEGEALEEGEGITLSKDDNETRVTIAASGTNMICIPIGTDPSGQTVTP